MWIRPLPVIAIETIATVRAAGLARMLAQSRCYCNAQEIVEHSPGIPGLFKTIPNHPP
jgi:hypothetical protein